MSYDPDDEYYFDRNYERRPPKANTAQIDQYIRGIEVSSSAGKKGIPAVLKQKMIDFFTEFIEDRSTKIKAMAILIIAMLQEI
jgi:hypothetical protein